MYKRQVFEQPTDIGGLFEETIARGAVSEDVLKDVALFYNHDLNTKPHARTRNNRLSFSIENDGVHVNASVNLERSDSKDFYLAVRDGDIDGMSFMFRVESVSYTHLNIKKSLLIVKIRKICHSVIILPTMKQR